jgi:signal peptidase II
MISRLITSQVARESAGRHAPTVALFLAVVAVMIAADLVVKTLAFRHVAGQPIVMPSDPDAGPTIPRHDAVGVVPKILSLRLTLNRGAAFGLAQGGRWFFVVVAVVAVGVVGWIFVRSGRRDRLLHVALALMLAGAIGNLYDRILFGQVRDMLWLFPGVHLPFGWRWPGGSTDLYPWIFNIADAAMFVALAMLLWHTWRQRDHAIAAGGEGSDAKAS